MVSLQMRKPDGAHDQSWSLLVVLQLCSVMSSFGMMVALMALDR